MRFFILVAYIFQVVLTVDVLLVSMKSKNILALIFSALFLSEYLFLRAYVLYITDVVSLEEDGPVPILFFFGVVDDFCFKCCFTPTLRSSLLAFKSSKCCLHHLFGLFISSASSMALTTASRFSLGKNFYFIRDIVPLDQRCLTDLSIVITHKYK